jgi:hypothetical protein
MKKILIISALSLWACGSSPESSGSQSKEEHQASEGNSNIPSSPEADAGASDSGNDSGMNLDSAINSLVQDAGNDSSDADPRISCQAGLIGSPNPLTCNVGEQMWSCKDLAPNDSCRMVGTNYKQGFYYCCP